MTNAEIGKAMHDLVSNCAGCDERWLMVADAALLRATIREYREDARHILDALVEPTPKRLFVREVPLFNNRSDK
jgi:hypothetical protein